MGGWGCSLEIGSEVCFPAREATVSSLLEAFGSLGSIVGIVAAQWLIDAGCAAMVLITMAIGSVCGGIALVGLSGRLYRSEAEAMECEPDNNVDPANGAAVALVASLPYRRSRRI